jgi:nitrile hydratase subunit beta
LPPSIVPTGEPSQPIQLIGDTMAAHALGTPKFKPGDPVVVDQRAIAGHCRTPGYLRGKQGVIAEVLGRFRNPERLAYHRPGLPAEVLYKVRFEQMHLWSAAAPTPYPGPAGDHLEADLYEFWLSGSTPQPIA